MATSYHMGGQPENVVKRMKRGEKPDKELFDGADILVLMTPKAARNRIDMWQDRSLN